MPFNAFGSLVSSGINAMTQAQINQRNREHDFDVMEMQQNLNQGNLISQRVYDSPIEQRRRLQQAGVNPFTAVDMLESDKGIRPESVTPQNTAGQFTPVSFDFSEIGDFLKQKLEHKQQFDLKDKDQQHEIKMIDKTFVNQMKLTEAKQAHEMIKLNASIQADMNKLLHEQQFEGNQSELMRQHQLELQKRNSQLQKDIAVLADYLSYETQAVLMSQQNQFTINKDERDFYNKYRLENQRFYHDYEKMRYQEKKIDERSKRGVETGVQIGPFKFGYHYADY